MEFLNKLKELLQAQTSAEFARMCGQQPPNMTNYLNGNATPGDRALEGCVLNAGVSRVFDNPPAADTPRGKKARTIRNRVVSNLFTQEVRPLWEIELVPTRQNRLPKSSGVYVLYDSGANVLYVGKAKDFRAEVWQTLDRKIPVGMRFGPGMANTRPTLRDLAAYVSLYEIDNAALRHNVEALLIRVFINQTHNRNIGKFKAA